MPAVSTSVSIRLTEPVVFLIGAVDFERSSARRRATRTPRRTPAGSRAGSRSNSRPPSPPPGLSITHADDHFVPPSPARGQAARAMSPGALAALGGTSRSASRSRITLGTTTGNGTQEENERVDEPPPAMLRGLLTITLAKSSRIRDITVKVKGAARTDWPEGNAVNSYALEKFSLISTMHAYRNWTSKIGSFRNESTHITVFHILFCLGSGRRNESSFDRTRSDRAG